MARRRRAAGPTAIAIAGAVLLSGCGGEGAEAPAAANEPRPVSLVLLTLDTTRSDFVGAYGAAAPAETPDLDALAARGTRWARAITPAPLTLPAHASILTGLDPPAHGVRENGVAALPTAIPTIAEALAAAGYRTGAFVASRVLDRRFGLGRGFEVYDDRIPAERMGEYGYAERDAGRVTAAAVAWLADRGTSGGRTGAPENGEAGGGSRAGRDAAGAGVGESAAGGSEPFFLWVHYYDPHAPYFPPGAAPGSSERQRYAGEIAFVDREIGRLLAALPDGGAGALVAAVGDHGEMLGEHGEPAHGLFLYRAALEVPLIVAGPGVPAGRVIEEPASVRDLAPSLLRLLGIEAPGPAGTGLGGSGLPGLPVSGDRPAAAPIYSEARLPAGAYGWSPLAAITEGRWRLVVAPRPELYDVAADPAESENLLAREPAVARRLERRLSAHLESLPRTEAPAPGADEELAAELAALGYLAGSAAAEAEPGRGLDPKDGIALLARYEAARDRLDRGDAAGAAAALGALVAESPGNLPFLTLWGRALFSAGRHDEAIAAYRRAVEADPALDLVHVNLADALLEAGRPEAAREEFRVALALNPGHARAWGRLAQIELAAGRPAEARRLLAEGTAAGAASASLLTRLAELDLAAGDPAAARAHLEEAVALEPEWEPARRLLTRIR